jgi:hypothetical protein
MPREFAKVGGDTRPKCASTAHSSSSLDGQRHLDSFHAKLDLVRDRVVGVAQGRTTGFYLFGPGGYGKS